MLQLLNCVGRILVVFILASSSLCVFKLVDPISAPFIAEAIAIALTILVFRN